MFGEASEVGQKRPEVGQVGHHLWALAARLAPDQRDPHTSRKEKSDMAAKLKRLADGLVRQTRGSDDLSRSLKP